MSIRADKTRDASRLRIAYTSRAHLEHGVGVYFADPHSSWQRGTTENTNRLLRQYFLNGTSMAHLPQLERGPVRLRKSP